MTENKNRSRVPGTTLLKIGRVLFNEHLLSAVVEPTISDLQREMADAGPHRARRLRAQLRGCWAFWKLVLVAPFATWASPPRDARAVFALGIHQWYRRHPYAVPAPAKAQRRIPQINFSS